MSGILGGGGGSSSFYVTDYYLSIHYGICAGPINFLREIFVGDMTKPAWSGRVAGVTQIGVDEPNLFGGNQKEGGVAGNMYILPGKPDQVLPDVVAQKLAALNGSQVPGFRGLASVFFYGPNGSTRGFTWGSNNPFLKPVLATVTRIPSSWYASKATIGGDSSTRRSIFIALDVSGSMAGSKLTIAQEAINTALEDIRSTINSGVDTDVAVRAWNVSSTQQGYTHATTGLNSSPDDITALETFVNGLTALTGTDFTQAADGAVAWFNLDSTIERRVFLFITDGIPNVGTDDTAATIMADLLDQTSGSYNVIDGTQVDCFGFNIVETDTSHTAKLDNTPQDGVPVITDIADAGALTEALLQAIGVDRPDMNPAHIIHEVLTNTDWGMSTPTYALDDTSFIAAADTLYAESFGLSMMWVQQSTIEDFIKEVLDHIEGVMYIDPQTGLINLKLIRNDYDSSTLAVLDETNSKIMNFQRKAWGDTTNEIVVSWTNPANEESETVIAQDLGNITIQGGVVSDSRNYYGVRNSTLAQVLAARDLRTASQPLATCELEVDRTAWNFVPGGVFKLSSAEYGIDAIVMRIGNIDYGTPGDSKIKITCIEDVFSKPSYTIIDTAPGTAFVGNEATPAAAAFQVAYTMPYFMQFNSLGGGTLTDPQVGVSILTGQTGVDCLRYDLWGPVTDSFGNTTQQYLGTDHILGHATFVVAAVAETTSTWPATQFTAVTQNQDSAPVVGGFILIDGGSEAAQEMCGITAFDGMNYTIKRGLLDTTPKAWPIGTPMYFFSSASIMFDPGLRTAGENLAYQLLTRTSLGTLDISLAPALDITTSERPYLPTRPANVQVNGVGFTPTPIDWHLGAPTTFPITWANRNRVTEDTILLGWGDTDITPEVGQTTTIEVVNGTGSPVYHTIDGLTGTSYTFTSATDFGSAELDTLIRVISKRASYESLQGHVIEVTLPVNEDNDWARWVASM